MFPTEGAGDVTRKKGARSTIEVTISIEDTGERKRKTQGKVWGPADERATHPRKDDSKQPI